MNALRRSMRGQRPFACVLVLLSIAWFAAARAAGVLDAVAGVAITVSDTGRAVRFYSDVLGFTLEREFDQSGPAWSTLYGVPDAMVHVARLRLGDERVDLLAFEGARGRAVPADAGSNDRSFQHLAIVVDDMATAYARLRAQGVRHASIAPQRLPDSNPQAGGIEAFYFRDPDGHFLELIHFPPGRGAARWQQPAERRGFRGIDHTAIAVRSTAEALALWRDHLGFVVVGESENEGIEQARLNNVPGAHLRITGLRAGTGPGVELLHYLAPDTGRAAPADSRPTDLWHWHVELVAHDATAFTAIDESLGRAGYRALSPAAIDLPADGAGLLRAHMWRDADGHALLLTLHR